MVNTTSPKVATDTNQSALLVCRAHAVPDLTFTWHNDSTLLLPGERIKITNSMVDGLYRFQSELLIADVKEHDLGDYRCTATNDIGSNSLLIHLTVQSE